MNKKTELNSDFSSLVSDLKENISYLKEIGVDSLDAKFPEQIGAARDLIPKTSDDEISNPPKNLKRFIQSKSPTKSSEKKKPSSESKDFARRRGSIFDSTKLSRLTTSRDLGFEKPKNPSEIISKPKEASMPKEKKQKESYGDFSVALPETSETLAAIHAEIGKDCNRCRLCENRTQVVNSVGSQTANLMFIGEAPGADEDAQGEPFVGRAGKLLTKIIEAINFKRDDVFIGNINRCRPPGNRQPQADEAEQCRPFLLREIAVVRPKVIVVMGNTACQNLLGTKVGITKLRGTFQDYFGVKVMPTFHPAYLLRDPRKKREVWDDLKTVRDYLEKN